MEKTKSNASAASGLTAKQRINHIVKWLKNYAHSANIDTFVVGISGGIDSGVVSALCARTGLKTIVVQMPIRQNKTLNNRSSLQATWLLKHFPDTVHHISVDLTTVFSAFEKKIQPLCGIEEYNYETYQLASANSRSRLRMMTLYQIAQCHRGLVVGTGNRVEDFGVGFFTKYGDGGVDISPIGDCLKTQVWDMGRELGLEQEIIDAPPTDGLWDDSRTDEDQIGMSYPDLERMMAIDMLKRIGAVDSTMPGSQKLSANDRKKLKRYQELRQRNMHKMSPIPVCKMPDRVV